jgi:hypothetical protein
MYLCSMSDLQDVLSSFHRVMDAAYAAILERGKFTWNQFWNGSPGCENAFLEP